MQNTKLKNMLLELASEATHAANSKVYTWDELESCIKQLQEFETNGHDLEAVLEQLN